MLFVKCQSGRFFRPACLPPRRCVGRVRRLHSYTFSLINNLAAPAALPPPAVHSRACRPKETIATRIPVLQSQWMVEKFEDELSQVPRLLHKLAASLATLSGCHNSSLPFAYNPHMSATNKTRTINDGKRKADGKIAVPLYLGMRVRGLLGPTSCLLQMHDKDEQTWLQKVRTLKSLE